MIVTNAMRLLKQAGIEFETSAYEVDESDLSGVHAAQMLGIDPDCMFKTLVTRSDKRNLYVFCIPVAQELDLKKCAAAVGEKKVEMIHVKELLGLTGYIRGGCSPVGMKKQFATFFDESIENLENIFVSGGMRGLAIEINKNDLLAFTRGRVTRLIRTTP